VDDTGLEQDALAMHPDWVDQPLVPQVMEAAVPEYPEAQLMV
jgi:hypothetical protein